MPFTATATSNRTWYEAGDAVNAAEVLRAASAGHEEEAARLTAAAGLDGLTETQMYSLCDLFGAEI